MLNVHAGRGDVDNDLLSRVAWNHWGLLSDRLSSHRRSMRQLASASNVDKMDGRWVKKSHQQRS
eukprot:9360488-Prorocentrum_lima.AAC.1